MADSRSVETRRDACKRKLSGEDSVEKKRAPSDASKRSKSRKAQQQRKRLKAVIPDCEYFFFDGHRHVHPYDFVYSATAKQRWFGRELFEVYSNEFVRYSKDYYSKAISTGRIRVNGEQVDLTYRIQNGDVIDHTVHRHEPPVSDREIAVIADTEDLLVIDKPPSMPLHPCGRYRYNSVQYILRQERKQETFIIHRLDRHTSGIVVLGKNQAAASSFSKDMRDLKLSKVYFARVMGEFPDKEITVDKAIGCVSKIYGEYKVDEDGKESKTIIRRVSYNGHTSLVECRPITGRTHQIRIHLQYLGFPIANDPCYGGKLYESNSEVSRKEYSPGEQAEFDRLRIKDRLDVEACEECQIGSYWNDDCRYCTFIWLHAFKYSGPGWTYQTEVPGWAKSDFDSRSQCSLSFPHNRTRI